MVPPRVIIAAASRSAFDRTARRLATDREKAEDVAVRALIAMVKDARREVVAHVADSAWDRAHQRDILRRLDLTLRQLGEQVERDVRQRLAVSWENGAKGADTLMVTLGGPGERIAVPVSRRDLETLQELGAELVKDVTEATRRRVAREVRLGIIAEKPAHEVARKIADHVGGTESRGEAIYRTETGRAYSTATETRYKEHDRARPGLRKVWLHSGAANPRPSHVHAGREYSKAAGGIPVSEDFILRPGADEAAGPGEYLAAFPRDPRLPAGLSVNCRCGHFAWREEWAA